jgi:hypothetical protein
VKVNGNGNRVNRSGFYYIMNPIAPINHAIKAKFDAIGTVLTLGLLISVVSLMRVFLSWVH